MPLRGLRLAVLGGVASVALSFGGTLAWATPGGGNSSTNSQASTHSNADANSSSNSQASTHSSGNPGTSGTSTSAQPLSNADMTGNGANPGTSTTNPYVSTRDGSPSLNGNGTGNATGKPCAGCVGKADNKNPPGQEQSNPMGTFPNNGYECDHNNGIGKSNPAHTGCTSSTPPPVTCVPTAANDNCGTPTPGCVPSAANDNCGTPTPGCVPSAANNNCSTSSVTTPSGETLAAGHSATLPAVTSAGLRLVSPATATPAAASLASNGALAFTGANIAATILLGLLLLGGGTAAVILSRRPRRLSGHTSD